MDFKSEILKMFGVKVAQERTNKGKSLLSMVDNYTVVDLETTGFSPEHNEIIEVGAIKYIDNKEVARFHSFIEQSYPLDEFITAHTGITNDMLIGAPSKETVLPLVFDFVGDSVVVAHNAHFDINFLYDDGLFILGRYFENSFIDTLRLAKRCLLSVENHKLTTLAKHFNIQQDTAHRSLPDCETTHNLYQSLKKYIIDNAVQLKSTPNDNRIANIQSNIDCTNPDNPFYKKYVVFTGVLDSMQRKDAAQLVVNLGGYLSDSVAKTTNFLVLGNLAYCSNVKGGKSKKYKKAEQLILSGQDLQIIPENVFISMIGEE